MTIGVTTPEKGSVQSETFKVMERRLLRGIINPAMIATWVLGFASSRLSLNQTTLNGRSTLGRHSPRTKNAAAMASAHSRSE